MLVKKFLFTLLVALTVSSSFAQTKGKNSFWDSYSFYHTKLFTDVANTKNEIEQKYASTPADDDTTLLLCQLLLFDIYEIHNDINSLKKMGLQLKSQEILFDDITIKSLIYVRYLKTMLYLRDEFGFEAGLNLKITQLKRKRDYYFLASIYSLIANHKSHLNQRDSSVYYMNLALSNARKQTDKNKLTDIIIDQAIIYGKIKNDEVSLSKAYLALQMAMENGYEYGKYKVGLILLTVNSKHLNYGEMRLNILQAQRAAQKINFQRGMRYVTLFELRYKSKFDEADKVKLQQLKDEITNDSDLMAIISEIDGKVALSEKDYTGALQKFNNAIVEFEKVGNMYGIQNVYQQLADVLLAQKKFDKALTYLEKSRNLLISLNEYTESTYLLRKVANIYELKGNKTKAFDVLNQYVNLKDSLQVADIQSNLLLVQQQGKADERERLITLQSDSIKIQQKEKAYTTTMLENVKLRNNLKTYIIIGFLGLILSGGIIVFFKWNQNLIQQSQREAEMNQTLLRTQMNPHFVFNAMSVIQSYIYDNDTQNSTKFLVNFSKLMRLILENSSKEFIPMEIEHEILDKYLSVQKLRFEDRFNFNIFTDENMLIEEVMIPPMITQPFIENAIEHGQLHLREDGFINITFNRLSNKLLEIKVVDNGIGRKKASKTSKKTEEHKSMAIGITKDRIDSLNKKYKTEGRLIFEDYDKENKSGTMVTITIPYLKNIV